MARSCGKGRTKTTPGGASFKDVAHTLAIALPPSVPPSYAGVGIRGETDIVLLITDSNGNVQSSNLYNYKGKTWGWTVAHSPAHPLYGSVLAIGGNFFDNSPTTSGLTILLTTLNGTILRKGVYEYDYFNYMKPSDLIICDGGGFLMIGRKYATLGCENRSTEFSTFIMKVNNKLDLEWTREIDILWDDEQYPEPQDLAYSVVEYYDASIGDYVYMVSGAQMSSSNISLPTRPFVLRIGGKGDIDWVRTYYFKLDNWATSASAQAIGKTVVNGQRNFVISGRNFNYGSDPNTISGPLNTFMMMIDDAGKPIWGRDFSANMSTSINVGNVRKNTYMVVNPNQNVYGVAAAAQNGMYLVETDVNGFSNNDCEVDFDVVAYDTDYCAKGFEFTHINFNGWTHTSPPVTTTTELLTATKCNDPQASIGAEGPDNNLYPNPASDALSITGIKTPIEVFIYKMSQEVVLQTLYKPGSPIDISFLQSGIYIVKWAHRSGKAIRRTLVVE